MGDDNNQTINIPWERDTLLGTTGDSRCKKHSSKSEQAHGIGEEMPKQYLKG
jgi:hypothetical protein